MKVRTSAPAGASKEPAPSADIAARKAAAAPCLTHGCERWLHRSHSPQTPHAQGRARNTHVPAAPPHLGARGRRRGPRDRQAPCHDCAPPVTTVAQSGLQCVNSSRAQAMFHPSPRHTTSPTVRVLPCTLVPHPSFHRPLNTTLLLLSHARRAFHLARSSYRRARRGSGL